MVMTANGTLIISKDVDSMMMKTFGHFHTVVLVEVEHLMAMASRMVKTMTYAQMDHSVPVNLPSISLMRKACMKLSKTDSGTIYTETMHNLKNGSIGFTSQMSLRIIKDRMQKCTQAMYSSSDAVLTWQIHLKALAAAFNTLLLEDGA